VKNALALARRVDQQQQKAINWLSPGDETPLETTIGYEQVAIDLTAWLAQNEPDPYVKQTFDFGLLEDFDHLYRYANLYELINGQRAEELTQDLTEIMPGRPTFVEHRFPADDVRRHFDRHTVDPLTRMQCMTLTAGEQQTMNFYMNHGPDYMEPIARGLYLEIAMIEEQHVTQYESLLDPATTWFENLVLHEYMECYLYQSFAAQETDERVRTLWEMHLDMEVEQLRIACDLMRRYDGKDPEEILPLALPDPVLFQPNKEYVRDILASQVEMTTDHVDFGAPKHARYEAYQAAVHGEGPDPSEQVIIDHMEQFGTDYRIETEGESPVPRLRGRTLAERQAS
jgi:hypothetical protein